MIDPNKKYNGNEAIAFVEKLAKKAKKRPEEVLASAGVSSVTWWAWRTGRAQPNTRTLMAIEASNTLKVI